MEFHIYFTGLGNELARKFLCCSSCVKCCTVRVLLIAHGGYKCEANVVQ